MKAEWRALGVDVLSRLSAIGDPARLMYFAFVVVGIGGLGVWLSADMTLFRANLATYAMGIAAAAAVELVLPDTGRSLKMLAISIGIVSIAASLLYIRVWNNLVWVAATCAWLLWMLSSSSNVNIGSPSPAAATGGDTDHVAGNLAGFET